MVIISHPLSRLVNSWHHKFHKLGIEHEQGLKLIRLVFDAQIGSVLKKWQNQHENHIKQV